MTNPGAQPGDRLAGMDYSAHNAEVREVWAALERGAPTRVPVILGTAPRYFFMTPEANPEDITVRCFFEDPDVMFDTALHFQRWSRFNLLQDAELGLPEVWRIGVDFQNVYEAGWFGCPIELIGGQLPDTRAGFADCPERVMEHGLPDPFGGLMGKALEYTERFRERAARETYLGRPIEIGPSGWATTSDGPFTVACNMFGADWTCMALASEPERLHVLLDFITESIIARIKAWAPLFGLPLVRDGFGIADDSIAMISTPMYREHVLPFHRRFYDTFGTTKGRAIHLCGNSTRHFKTIHDKLGVTSFDTGFPVDFAWLRKELGPDVRIQGGPHIELLRTGTLDEVRAETERILKSGIMDGGQFVLREGNNLAPCTPFENTEAMYEVGRTVGRYEQ